MKVRSLFDLVEQAQDLCSFFSDVETPEQMVSRLERLKRGQGAPQELLESIEGTRLAIEAAMSDTLEIGASTSLDDIDLEGLGDLNLEEQDQEAPPPAPDPGSQAPDSPLSSLVKT